MKNLKTEIKNIVAGWPGRQLTAGFIVGGIGYKYVSIINQWQNGKDFKMTLQDFYDVYITITKELTEEMYIY